MPTLLHDERLDAVVSALLERRATRVVDLGCGRGDLLLRLREYPQFVRLVGIDVDARALDEARGALELDWLHPDGRIEVRDGTFDRFDPDLAGVDAAVLLETIEHVAPDRLSGVERAVFGGLRPRTVLVTTPNRDYNSLHGLAPGERRHPGHRFEWGRVQFRAWSSGVAGRNGYAVKFADIGPADPVLGSSTQMARFEAGGGQ